MAIGTFLRGIVAGLSTRTLDANLSKLSPILVKAERVWRTAEPGTAEAHSAAEYLADTADVAQATANELISRIPS